MRESKEIFINGNILEKILENHKHWLNRDIAGWGYMRANLNSADLSGADLSSADLRYIKLRDVYSEFIRVYPLLSVIFPFDYFAKLVDRALALLREKLEESAEVKELIFGE